MHCSKHASDEFVYAIAFLHERHQSRYPAFVVGTASKMGENEFLKGVNLILKGHEIRDSLITMEMVSYNEILRPKLNRLTPRLDR